MAAFLGSCQFILMENLKGFAFSQTCFVLVLRANISWYNLSDSQLLYQQKGDIQHLPCGGWNEIAHAQRLAGSHYLIIVIIGSPTKRDLARGLSLTPLQSEPT